MFERSNSTFTSAKIHVVSVIAKIGAVHKITHIAMFSEAISFNDILLFTEALNFRGIGALGIVNKRAITGFETIRILFGKFDTQSDVVKGIRKCITNRL
jgi:hypothetical protein